MHAFVRVLSLAALAVACSAAERSAEPADGTPVASVNGVEITLGELDAWIKDEWFREQVEGKGAAAVHEFRDERLRRMIDERLLEAEARTRGTSVEELLSQQAASATVSDDEVKAFFDANRARLGDATLEQIGPRIRQHLQQQKAHEAVQRFVADLRKNAAVEVSFEAPRIEVAVEGPSRGPAAAAVTIVEFSDFQCPYCARSGPVVKQILERYPQQVRLVYRHFPIDSIHPRARPAAEASLCAAEQQRFWEYHDALFASEGALADADLARYAADLGLDAAAFQQCYSEGRYRGAVERDVAEARRVGVTGTPSFFVNGRMLGGAVPFEEFVKVIESELARAGGAAASS